VVLFEVIRSHESRLSLHRPLTWETVWFGTLCERECLNSPDSGHLCEREDLNPHSRGGWLSEDSRSAIGAAKADGNRTRAPRITRRTGFEGWCENWMKVSAKPGHSSWQASRIRVKTCASPRR
jgi:hypothetical protein